MSEYLGEHPDIFMAVKELQFFGQDLVTRPISGGRDRRGVPDPTGHAGSLSRERYLEYFAASGAERYRCDSSVGCLYSSTAAAEIKEFAPEGRILVHFRNPVDMLYSMHSLTYQAGVQPTRDFAQALEQPYWWASATSGYSWRFAPRSIVKYAEALERYFDAFGRDRVHVLIFEEFVADPHAAYLGILDFLGLADEGRVEFPVVNANRGPRSHILHRALHGSADLRRLARVVVRNQRVRRALGARLIDANTSHQTRDTLDPVLRRRLAAEFAPEVDKLASLLGRDLSGWSPTSKRTP